MHYVYMYTYNYFAVPQTSLPVAKLCALVSMNGTRGNGMESFSLPMKLIAQEVMQKKGKG